MAANPGAISPLEDFALGDTPQGLGYANQSKLADALHKQNPDNWKRKTLGSQISKYFNFGLPLSDRFKTGLRGLAHGELKDRLQKAIEQHEEEHQRRNDPVRIMSNRYASARQVVFIGLEPISANMDRVPASLIDLFRFSFQEIVSGNLSAIMGVPSREIAVGIWTAVSTLAEERAQSNSNQGTARDLLAILDRKLLLFSLPRQMCVHTTLVFDPNEPHGVGYTWYMPWDWRSPAKMPPTVLEAWKQEFLKPLEDCKLHGQPLTPIPRA